MEGTDSDPSSEVATYFVPNAEQRDFKSNIRGVHTGYYLDGIFYPHPMQNQPPTPTSPKPKES